MQHKKLPSADTEIIGEDRWNAQNQREDLLEKIGLYSRRAEAGWLVPTENLEMMLLKLLLKLKRANVYEISKSKNVGHYSTVLRGLRRMEKRKLVYSILKCDGGRHKKIYQVTLLGELVAYLAKGGWKGTSKRIASKSSNFRDCQAVHELYDPCYYWRLTQRILEKMLQQSSSTQEIDLEQIVAETEFNWIETNIIEKLSERKNLAENLDLLERLGNIEWIRSMIVQKICQYFEEWKEWLNAIEVVKTKLTN